MHRILKILIISGTIILMIIQLTGCSSTARGGAAGAAAGGAAGAYIGNYMDRQADEMREDIEDAKIERVGEGIKITFDSGILFPFDESTLTAESRREISQLADILKKYKKTKILIEGHTDSKGSKDYNLDLSRDRAQSVVNFLVQKDINATRFSTMGYGESQPEATNATAEGRAKNRRVEIAIYANDELKEVARDEAGS